jgi:VWFA-related protein
VDVPVPAGLDASAPESDVRTLSESQHGRVYVLLLDDLHTAPARTALLKAGARTFIQKYFYPGDLAAVIYAGPGQGAGQELTGSRELLFAAVDRFHGQQIDSAADGRLSTYHQQQLSTDRTSDAPDPKSANMTNSNTQTSTALADPDDAERSFNARRTLETIRKAAQWMAGIDGRRKSLIFFSEGVDYDVTDIFNSPDSSGVEAEARESVGAAARANVSIYAVDPRGLAGSSDEFIDLIEPLNSTQTAREQLGTRGIERDLRRAQNNLRMLAEETGGLSFVNTNDFGRGFERVVRDNSSYYVLGYYTERDAKAGKFRKIDVRIRRPGLQVRARRGYVTSKPADPKTAPSSVLMEAVRSPVPAGNLPMRVFATSFKGDGKNTSAVIVAEISGDSLKFRERDGLFLDAIDFSAVAVDGTGMIAQADNGTVSLTVNPEVRQRIAQAGVRFLSRISLPPARYQLRIAAHESSGGAASVVHYDLVIPDYSKDRLGMTGLVLTMPSAVQMATPRADAALQQILPTPPTAERAFHASDTLNVYAEIYDNAPQPARELDIVTTVTTTVGPPVFSSHTLPSIAETASVKFPYVVQVPLKSFAPGAYVLRVEVRSRVSGASVLRQVPFVVR